MKESTPCIKICMIHSGSGLCQGCGRTLDEIQRWPLLSEPERIDIMAGLASRLARSRADRLASAGRTNRRRAALPCTGTGG